jgi:NADH-quinone oxidoreductase subunit L
MRKMGGLRKYMPITYWTFLVGSLALIGFPGFAGFFSKDAIIEAVGESHLAGAGIAYWSVLLGVFITALYTFRMFFMVFHGEERMDAHTKEHVKESPWVVTVPLTLLAIPSLIIGWFTIGPVLFGGYFGSAIHVASAHDVLGKIGEDYHGPLNFVVHGFEAPALYIALFGVFIAWLFYMKRPDLPEVAQARATWLYNALNEKLYFDTINERVFAAGARALGRLFWHVGDETLIDGAIVNGTANTVGWFAGIARRVQSGYLYHYAFAMIIGLCGLLGWFIWR